MTGISRKTNKTKKTHKHTYSHKYAGAHQTPSAKRVLGKCSCELTLTLWLFVVSSVLICSAESRMLGFGLSAAALGETQFTIPCDCTSQARRKTKPLAKLRNDAEHKVCRSKKAFYYLYHTGAMRLPGYMLSANRHTGDLSQTQTGRIGNTESNAKSKGEWEHQHRNK